MVALFPLYAFFKASHDCEMFVDSYSDHLSCLSYICFVVDFAFDYIACQRVLLVRYSDIVFEMTDMK